MSYQQPPHGYPQPGYQGPPPQGYYQQGPPPQGYYEGQPPYPPQQGYGPPPPATYAQPQPTEQKSSSGGKGCLGSCLAVLCCCFVCEEGCECCAECIECCEMC